MKGGLNVLLFDVDGVLVEPRAYRIGALKTVEFLCQKCGIANWRELLPSDSEIDYMESLGIHDVWDITNIVFAQLIADFCRALPRDARESLTGGSTTPGNGDDVQQLLKWLRIQGPISLPRSTSYNILADQIAGLNANLPHPPDAAHKLLNESISSLVSPTAADAWNNLLSKFLAGSRDPRQSYGTRVFQNVILGSAEFANTYGIAAEYDGSPLLEAADVPIISSESVELAEKLNQQPNVRVAVYTARPSLAPTSAGHLTGYSPEAEMAMTICGMNIHTIPLVGMGAMDWLAEEYGKRSEDLTKPNTTQALCAFAAAIRQNSDCPVLREAYAWDSQQNIDPALLEMIGSNGATIYVFEDTVSGIRPMLKLAERLRSVNCLVNVVALGIAKDPHKRKALAALCGDKLFDNVNDALAFVLRTASEISVTTYSGLGTALQELQATPIARKDRGGK